MHFTCTLLKPPKANAAAKALSKSEICIRTRAKYLLLRFTNYLIYIDGK